MWSKRSVKVGNVAIGGDAPISVQGMTTVKPTMINQTMQQIREMVAAGADIVRVAVPDMESVESLRNIKELSPVPVVADCHLDPKVAIEAAKVADKLRLNPKNMPRYALKEIVSIVKDRQIPIRVGANSGSSGKYNTDPHGLIDIASRHIDALLSLNFEDIVLSFKSPDPQVVIETNLLARELWNFPIHLGLTQAGKGPMAMVYSTATITTLLNHHVGDTLRISLTDSPKIQIQTGVWLLQSLGLRKPSARLISCPVCGRARFNVQDLVDKISPIVDKLNEPLTVSVIGCEINGTGEASAADVAFFGTPSNYQIFKKGRLFFKGDFDTAERTFIELIESFISK